MSSSNPTSPTARAHTLRGLTLDGPTRPLFSGEKAPHLGRDRLSVALARTVPAVPRGR